MRRALLMTALLGIPPLSAGLPFWKPGPLPAGPGRQETAQGPADKLAKSGQLPIAQVVLYSSGVGYFQRAGTVEGDARVDLTFPAQDVDDLLKSLVVRDLDGGAVAAVSYDASAPLEHALKSFALDLTRNPSQAELLNQARGER